MRKVDDGGKRVKEPERINVRSSPVQSDPNSLCFKVGFLVVFALVINCTAQMEHIFQKIDLVVVVADTFLGV